MSHHDLGEYEWKIFFLSVLIHIRRLPSFSSTTPGSCAPAALSGTLTRVLLCFQLAPSSSE